MNLSNEIILQNLNVYGVTPTTKQCDQIRSYISLLLRWNRSVSLTAVIDELEILKFHFGESVFALRSVQGVFGRLADVGSGAGFPGVPLCIFREDLRLVLIESNAKKCAFLSEVVREIGLLGVEVMRARFDEIRDIHGTYNVVTARALGGYDRLLDWSRGALSEEGRVVLWLGRRDSMEISHRRDWIWHHPVLIPGSQERFIISGTPKMHGRA